MSARCIWVTAAVFAGRAARTTTPIEEVLETAAGRSGRCPAAPSSAMSAGTRANSPSVNGAHPRLATTCSPPASVIVARCPPTCRRTAPTSPAADSVAFAGRRTESAFSTTRRASYVVLLPERASVAARSTAVWASTRSPTEAGTMPRHRAPCASTNRISSP